ncbi:MAG: hypothetical protein ACRD7E_16255, partial [Bryobacteraceae bacterium]
MEPSGITPNPASVNGEKDSYPEPETAAYELKKLTVGLAGSEDAYIEDYKPTFYRKLAPWLVIPFFMFLEWITGFDIWKVGSNQLLAFALNLITVIGFTVLTGVTIRKLKPYFAYRDALVMYSRVYPNGHSRGFTVFPFPPSERNFGFIALTVLVLASIAVLIARILVGGPTNFAAIAGAIALLFTVVLYGFVKYWFTPLYNEQDYNRLRESKEAEAYRQECEAEQRRRPIEKPTPPNPLEAQKDLWAAYVAKRDAIVRRGQEKKTEAEAEQHRLIDLIAEYQTEWRKTSKSFADACDELAATVANELDPYTHNRLLLRRAKEANGQDVYYDDTVQTRRLLATTLSRALLE